MQTPAEWNHFFPLLNIYGVNDVRKTEIHTGEPLFSDPSAFEFELAIEKLKRYESPDIDQIPSELIKAGCRTIRSEVHKLICSIWNKEELPEEWKESAIVPIYRKGDKQIVVIKSLSILSATYNILSTSCCRG